MFDLQKRDTFVVSTATAVLCTNRCTVHQPLYCASTVWTDCCTQHPLLYSTPTAVLYTHCCTVHPLVYCTPTAVLYTQRCAEHCSLHLNSYLLQLRVANSTRSSSLNWTGEDYSYASSQSEVQIKLGCHCHGELCGRNADYTDTYHFTSHPLQVEN